jgi:hypothetical protein
MNQLINWNNHKRPGSEQGPRGVNQMAASSQVISLQEFNQRSNDSCIYNLMEAVAEVV